MAQILTARGFQRQAICESVGGQEKGSESSGAASKGKRELERKPRRQEATGKEGYTQIKQESDTASRRN